MTGNSNHNPLSQLLITFGVSALLPVIASHRLFSALICVVSQAPSLSALRSILSSDADATTAKKQWWSWFHFAGFWQQSQHPMMNKYHKTKKKLQQKILLRIALDFGSYISSKIYEINSANMFIVYMVIMKNTYPLARRVQSYCCLKN